MWESLSFWFQLQKLMVEGGGGLKESMRVWLAGCGCLLVFFTGFSNGRILGEILICHFLLDRSQFSIYSPVA